MGSAGPLCIIRAPVTSTCCGTLASSDDSNVCRKPYFFEVDDENTNLLDEDVVVSVPLSSLADEWT
ncbi:hypothetical protein EMPG_14672 [Blastomyces silverae]|uniref:Uncharacterized protein n=1 Tax=Blastomyces silverae TaxID=2060906 RepID=A0A0H1BEM6_9EURO|nr:hypothetical protein EMPG_14672 [Blastomyces silverae]